jgi:hypothetical protein
MMGYLYNGYGYGGGMMGSSFGFLGLLTWVVFLIDGILLGLWLWQKISKN